MSSTNGPTHPPQSRDPQRRRELGSGRTLFCSPQTEADARVPQRRGVKLVDPLAINAYDVMNHGTVVLTRQALSRVVETLGG